MGNCCSSDDDKKKPFVTTEVNGGLPPHVDRAIYRLYKDGETDSSAGSDEVVFRGIKVRPFDIVMVRGNQFGSKLIMFASSITGCRRKSDKHKHVEADDFSHIGMIVTSAILDHPKVEPGKVYIWESTKGAVPDVFGRNDFCCQLRELDAVCDYMERNQEDGEWGLAISKLLPEFRAKLGPAAEVKEKFTAFFDAQNHAEYNANLAALLGCVDILPGADALAKLTSDDESKAAFCSELQAITYVAMGMLPSSIDPAEALPLDFLGNDNDGEIPCMGRYPWFVVGNRTAIHEGDAEAKAHAAADPAEANTVPADSAAAEDAAAAAE